MKKRKKWILALLLLCAALLAGSLLLSTPRFQSFSPADYTESARELHNPYIGWYRMYGYRLSDAQPPDISLISKEECETELVLLELNLADYADCPVSSAGLAQLDGILSAWRSAGKQLLLRFLYDWDGNGLEAEPKRLSLIQEHMTQTAQVVNRYADCVYLLQGAFIGSWGELHSSNYMTDEDLTALTEHLAQTVDPGILLAVRTPEQWRTVTGSDSPPAPEPASSGSLSARLGLFNDGMMGSETDMGTYAPEGAAPTDSFGKRPRQEELLFQNSLCVSVPNGGEAACSTPYNDFPAAVESLSTAHISYLNGSYSQEVLSKWREYTYSGEDVFSGMNGYDYIARHLGYRYVLRAASFSASPSGNTKGVLSVSIENVGFANAYRPFQVSLTLRHYATGMEHPLQVQTDPRTWNAGEKVRLEIPMEAAGLSPGRYEAVLTIRDSASGREILLANEGAGSGGTGCPIGALTVGILP